MIQASSIGTRFGLSSWVGQIRDIQPRKLGRLDEKSRRMLQAEYGQQRPMTPEQALKLPPEPERHSPAESPTDFEPGEMFSIGWEAPATYSRSDVKRARQNTQRVRAMFRDQLD